LGAKRVDGLFLVAFVQDCGMLVGMPRGARVNIGGVAQHVLNRARKKVPDPFVCLVRVPPDIQKQAIATLTLDIGHSLLALGN